jgi:glycyl-tRNA synthetase beta chain
VSAADFLLEVGVEELPAGYIEPALGALAEGLTVDLRELRLGFGEVRTYATPRRLAVRIDALATRQCDAEEEVLGPAVKAAYDGDGQPTKALLGFARGRGVDVGAVRRIATGKGEYIAATVRHVGKPAADVLPAAIEKRLAALPFPKTMRWSTSTPSFRFARPVRWLVALHGDAVLPARAGDVAAGRETRGHRFLAPAPLPVATPSAYEAALEGVSVIADRARRRADLSSQAERLASQAGGRLVPDEELADLVNFMVEKPVAALGKFDAAYLDLPREVVVTAMREHQRYFAVEDDGGRLLPCFVVVTNGCLESLDGIVRGNERVLRARLDDARYYWETDLQHPPGERVKELSDVTWIEGMGTMLDKARRVEQLAGEIAGEWAPADAGAARRAALLMKTDLLGEMIGSGKEYAALEGTMGALYAARHGEPAAVVAAIRDHLQPRYAGDALPETAAGAALAVADRLDTVSGCFLAGKIPTGSEDPYGVRRAGNGVVRILLEQERHLDLEQAGARTLARYEREGGDTSARLAEFWKGRVAAALEDRGVAYDEVAAVVESTLGWRDPLDALRRARALAAHRQDESFRVLVVGYKRVANILRAEADAPASAAAAPGGAAWNHPAERALAEALATARARALPLYERREYAAVLDVLLALRTAIDSFFTDAMVNDPNDPAARLRRLGLLAEVRDLFQRGFDLSRIVVEG